MSLSTNSPQELQTVSVDRKLETEEKTIFLFRGYAGLADGTVSEQQFAADAGYNVLIENYRILELK